MAMSSAFMGPWFAWWYPYLAANYASIWTRLGLELFTAQFLHVGFLMCYYLQHFGSLPSWNEFVKLAIELVQVDLLIFSPIALINFKFIPVGIWQTVFVNTGYVTVVEPVGSLVINNGLQVQQLFNFWDNKLTCHEINLTPFHCILARKNEWNLIFAYFSTDK